MLRIVLPVLSASKTASFLSLTLAVFACRVGHIVMAACLFKPGGSPASAKSAELRSLHRMYLSVLEYSIRSRSTASDDVIQETRKLMDTLEAFEILAKNNGPKAAVTTETQEPVYWLNEGEKTSS